MHRYFKSSTLVIFSVCSALAIAGGFDYTKEDLSGYNLQPNLQVGSDSEYARSGHALYFYGGFLYANRFLSSNTQTLSDAPVMITYVPKTVFPSNFDGFEFGVGKELSRHVEVQLAYLQNLTAKKDNSYMGIPFSVSSKLNAVLADVGLVLNPDDQFQVVGRVGAMVSEAYNTVSVNNVPVSALAEDQTSIEPAAGLDLIWQFSSNVAFRLGGMYVADTHNQFSHGQLNGLAALSYTL